MAKVTNFNDASRSGDIKEDEVMQNWKYLNCFVVALTGRLVKVPSWNRMHQGRVEKNKYRVLCMIKNICWFPKFFVDVKIEIPFF